MNIGLMLGATPNPNASINYYQSVAKDCEARGFSSLWMAHIRSHDAVMAMALAAAATTILAGALLVEVTRQWAFDALERRIHRLAGDIGSALWPGSPAQIVTND